MKLGLKTLAVAGMLALGTARLGANAVQISEDTQLHMLAKLEFVYDENLFRVSENSTEDRYLIFSPGLEFRISPEGAASAILRYQHHFTRYRDYSSLDDDFADLSLQARYDSGVVLATAAASYRELASNTVDFQQEGVLIEREETALKGDVRYEISNLTAVKAGVAYDETDFEDSIYTDHETVSVPVTLYYKVRPNVDLTAGMRYRTVDTSSGTGPSYDFEDMFYYVGAVGELFSPVVFADLTVGFQERDYDGASVDDSSSSYDLSLIYTGAVKTTVYASMGRDYRTSAIGGNSYTFTNASLGARYHLTHAVGLSAELTYGESDYKLSNRAEDMMFFHLGATYQPNDYLTLDARYQFSDIDGNNQDGAANYENNEFRVSASLRY